LLQFTTPAAGITTSNGWAQVFFCKIFNKKSDICITVPNLANEFRSEPRKRADRGSADYVDCIAKRDIFAGLFRNTANMQVITRAFEEQDSAAVIALWHLCNLTRPWNNPQKDIQRKCAVHDNLFLVALNDNNIVGTVMGGYEGHRGWVNYLAVHPDFRRLGIARQLMQNVESKLLALGCPKINLQIRLDNVQACAFYASLGFSDDQCTSMGKRLIDD